MQIASQARHNVAKRKVESRPVGMERWWWGNDGTARRSV